MFAAHCHVKGPIVGWLYMARIVWIVAAFVHGPAEGV
jgi:hypothetical protein